MFLCPGKNYMQVKGGYRAADKMPSAKTKNLRDVTYHKSAL